MRCAHLLHCDASYTACPHAGPAAGCCSTCTCNLSGTVSFFEATIRVVGGLASASQLSGDAALGGLGADLAGRLLPAFTWAPTGALRPVAHR